MDWPDPAEVRPRWNVAPSQEVPLLRVGADGKAEIAELRWGFAAPWAGTGKPGGAKGGVIAPINARSETAATSPMFRSAMRSRRCIVPVSGFYEWKPATPAADEPAKTTKRPHYIHAPGQGILLLAGLWEPAHADDEAGGGRGTFAILTTRPNALMSGLHDRMPVILRPGDAAGWMAPAPLADASRYFEPYPAEEMRAYRVSNRVNSPRNEGAGLTEPWSEPEEAPGLFG